MSSAGASPSQRIVIVGASLSGLRAAEQLRVGGHRGPITVIGAEPHAPYDRPPLSKSLLTSPGEPVLPVVGRRLELGIDWILGTDAVGLNPADHQVELGDGRVIDFDSLLIATGRRARAWSDPEAARYGGVLTLRSFADSCELRARLDRGPRRVVIIGAGFIGSEVASACRERGIPVTVVARGLTPLDGALGATVGAFAVGLYERNGVDLRRETTVLAMDADSAGAVSRVELDDGTSLTADLVVVATGSIANVDWLAGSGISASGGVAVDGQLRALGANGRAVADIFAAGDVTRWGHPLFAGRRLSIEHWGNAVDQARFAARSMCGLIAEDEMFSELPRFWSTMFGTNIKAVGVPSFADEVVAVQGSRRDRRGVAVYGAAGRVVAAVAVDSPRELQFFEAMVRDGAAFPPAIVVPDWGADLPPVPMAAAFPVRASSRPNTSDGAVSGVLEALGGGLAATPH